MCKEVLLRRQIIFAIKLHLFLDIFAPIKEAGI